MKAFLLFLLQLALVASQVAIKIASDAPLVFQDERKEPKFIVGTLPEGSPAPPHARTLTMRDANGTQYSCYIPAVGGQRSSGGGGGSEVAELELQQPTPSELLEALTDWCAYRVEDWWTYEVCYKRHVRQFHKEQAKVVAEYQLGTYNEALSTEDDVQTDPSDVTGELKYVSQRYTGGEPCELTGQARSTEVRYVCGGGSGEHVISSIKEPASCSYLITISTPRLCKHPDFRTEPPPVSAIRCIPQPPGGQAAAAAEGEAGAAEAREAQPSGALVALPASAGGAGRCSPPGGGAQAAATCNSPRRTPAHSDAAGGATSERGSGSGDADVPKGEAATEVADTPPPSAQQPAANVTAEGEEEWSDEYEEGGPLVEGEPALEGAEEEVWGEEMYDAAMRALGNDNNDQGNAVGPEDQPGRRDEL